MLYVQQSLNPNEEIVKTGHFHWWYVFSSALSLVIGVIGFMLILYAGYYWQVSQFISNHFQGLPQDLYGQAWDETVARMGGFFSIIIHQHFVLKILAFLFLLYGLFSFGAAMIVMHTTEICLTTERLIIKRGVISRFVEEIAVNRVEGVEVHQSVLGRMLGFGRVITRGMGVGEIDTPNIADPIEFRKAIDRARAVERDERF